MHRLPQGADTPAQDPTGRSSLVGSAADGSQMRRYAPLGCGHARYIGAALDAVGGSFTMHYATVAVTAARTGAS
jgi:hypothetical protein